MNENKLSSVLFVVLNSQYLCYSSFILNYLCDVEQVLLNLL